MATARQIIGRALRLIQVMAAGETPRAAEASDALEALNDMLASWSASNLIVPCMVKGKLATTPGSARVILPSRPMRVVGAWINDGVVDQPMAVIGQADYLGIADKAFRGLPTSLYFDELYPTASVYLYPVPDLAYAVTLQRWMPLEQIDALDDGIDLPGEYREALSANLAVRLAPEYGTSASSEVSAMASTALDLLRGLHAQPVATLSAGIQGTSQRYAPFSVDSMALLRSGTL